MPEKWDKKKFIYIYPYISYMLYMLYILFIYIYHLNTYICVYIYTHTSVGCCSVSKSCPALATPQTATCQASLSFTISWSLPKFMFLSWWCYYTISSSAALFFFCLQSFPGSGPFSNESALPIRWPKYWSFSFSISPSSEYSGLISFRMDWFDLFAVQVTFKSLLQHHNLKASILQCSAFLMVQLTYP